jgi:dienelactone hydrolase
MDRLDNVSVTDVAVAVADYDEIFTHLDEHGKFWDAPAPYKMINGYGAENFSHAIKRAALTVQQAQKWYDNLPTVIWGYSQGGPVAVEVSCHVEHCVGTMVWCSWGYQPTNIEKGRLAIAHLNKGDPHVDADIAELSLPGFKVLKHEGGRHSENAWWFWEFFQALYPC